MKIPAPSFLKAMEKDFALTRRVISVQEKKIWRLGHQLKNTMGSIYLERKLAAKLWKLARDFGKAGNRGIEIDIQMSVTFLADLLGAPRETTSPCVQESDGTWIDHHEKKRIYITDADRMACFYKTGRYEEG